MNIKSLVEFVQEPLDVVYFLSEWMLLSLLTGRRGEGPRLETNSTFRSRTPRRYCVDAGEES